MLITLQIDNSKTGQLSMKYKIKLFLVHIIYLMNFFVIFRRVHEKRLLKAPPQDEIEPRDSVSELE